MKKMLENFFTQEELNKMNSMRFSKYSYLRDVLEGRFLEEARRIVSGREVGGDAMKYAMILREYSNSTEEYKM
ncbi:hypothetical protein [Aquitalea magnusonii]|uniref:hypothetical protein n=1 Tax=Aquitalea magnusonii TaxID=332411 RepID=UPI0011AE73C0|nr:hypothetical protein [Aquitalea magnusonii]